jgi:malate permease and related proteins
MTPQGEHLLIELLQIFADNIMPILVIAGVGFFIGRHLQVDPKPLGRMIFVVLSPVLIFQSISTSEISGTELIGLILIMVLFVLIMAVIAYFVLHWRDDVKPDKAAVMLGAVCANNGNFGLPLISFAFGPTVFARAVVIFIATTILNYTIGVFIASSGRRTVAQAFGDVAHVPAIYAAIAGLIINFGAIELPPLVARPIALLSQATIPMMLILLGLQLAQSAVIVQPGLVSLGVGLRLLISPFVALALVLAFGLDASAGVAVIMQASMPVAVVTIIFASEFELDRQLILSMILVSTLLSPLTLSVLIFVIRRLVPAIM